MISCNMLMWALFPRFMMKCAKIRAVSYPKLRLSTIIRADFLTCTLALEALRLKMNPRRETLYFLRYQQICGTADITDKWKALERVYCGALPK
jgi:hypothetical protein